jgi:hypothetical protein
MLPGIVSFLFRIRIGKMSKVGQISLPASEKLKSALGVTLMITYMVIVELTGIALG